MASGPTRSWAPPEDTGKGWWQRSVEIPPRVPLLQKPEEDKTFELSA